MSNDANYSPIHPASMRICVYGSSSSSTPQSYLSSAFSLGRLLAERGHVCVNGGGKFGCMGSLNDGCNDALGKVVGVIHEMFLLDGAEHFDESAPNAKNTTLVVARGDDLQERKRLLVERCDGIIVLPGGTGTWDELWEMACQKNLGLFDKPIVCVNVDGFYDDFKSMLVRAEKDTLMRLKVRQRMASRSGLLPCMDLLGCSPLTLPPSLPPSLFCSQGLRGATLRPHRVCRPLVPRVGVQ